MAITWKIKKVVEIPGKNKSIVTVQEMLSATGEGQTFKVLVASNAPGKDIIDTLVQGVKNKKSKVKKIKDIVLPANFGILVG